MKKPTRQTSATSSQRFSCGDLVIYTYTKKTRRAKSLVTIIRVLESAYFDLESSTPLRLETDAYGIRSEFGGELTVSAENLRPGNVLDRINSALED